MTSKKHAIQKTVYTDQDTFGLSKFIIVLDESVNVRKW